jgi:hypothetical protein
MGQQRGRENTCLDHVGCGLDDRSMRDLREERGRIVIEPVWAQSYGLDALIDELDPSEFPENPDFGPARGRETW